MDGYALTRIVALLAVLFLVATGLVAQRNSWPTLARHAIIWLAVGAILVLGASYFDLG